MIMSFFQAVDVMPFVQDVDLIVNGNEIVLTEEEQTTLKEQVSTLFENGRVMPAFGVITPQMYEEQIQDGIFVSLKFDKVLELNGLPFDELVFKVQEDFQGFNLARGMNGVFQGRCVYIDLNGQNMQELSSYINSIPAVQTELANDADDNADQDVEEDEDFENTETPNVEEGNQTTTDDNEINDETSNNEQQSNEQENDGIEQENDAENQEDEENENNELNEN